MKTYRITKYNPKFRDKNDVYTRNEWTSVSDINNIFDDGLLTQSKYLRVEKNYIEAIRLILEELESTYLKVVGIEKHSDIIEKTDNLIYTKEDELIFQMSEEGAILFVNDGLKLFKLILREKIWCYLVNKEIIIKIGYDYCLNVTLSGNLKCFSIIENDLGLYIE